MDFDEWKEELAKFLGRAFSMDGAEYIRLTGDECWREMYADGLTPEQAAQEEVAAARDL